MTERNLQARTNGNDVGKGRAMTLELPAAHAAALDETRSLVAGISAHQWHAPTPCADWDVREVVNHIVSGNWWVTPLMTGSTIDDVGDRLDGDVLGDDPLKSYDASAKEAAAAFEAPGAMDAPANVSYGPVPGRVYAGHRLIDVLVHGWDVAVATGQETTLRPDLVDACLGIVLAEAELLAGSGMFGDSHDAPDADPQTRLLSLLGRAE
jgi:uncharacterized protein (TIGR03086 family)